MFGRKVRYFAVKKFSIKNSRTLIICIKFIIFSKTIDLESKYVRYRTPEVTRM